MKKEQETVQIHQSETIRQVLEKQCSNAHATTEEITISAFAENTKQQQSNLVVGIAIVDSPTQATNHLIVKHVSGTQETTHRGV